jgi:regulatory protein
MPFKPRRSVRIPTPESLAQAALRYLARYAASEQSLRQALLNRLRRASLLNENFAANAETQMALRGVIENIIDRHRKAGILNDTAFAAMKTQSLRRSGRSRRAIQRSLSLKGVAAPLIDMALADHEDECADAEVNAATVLARRRKFGPFRRGEATPEQLRRELAAMARAGFPLDVARRVLQQSVTEEWE